MFNLLLSVTDHELLTAQVVKIIFVLLLFFGIGYNLLQVYRSRTWTRRLFRAVFAGCFLAVVLPVIQWIRIENSMLREPRYTVGVTTGFCEVFARGKGVAFEYEAGKAVFRNCNTFHPIAADSIVASGGRYHVRYSEKYPGKGRMDFHRKVE